MKAFLFRKRLAIFIASCSIAAPALGINGTWNTSPANGDWNVRANWSAMGVPNGPADIATFGLSSITSVFLSANTEVDSIVFSPGASAYTITASPTRALTVKGAGIVNNSGSSQSLVAGVDGSGRWGLVRFTHNAAVGSSTTLVSSGSMVRNVEGAVIEFRDASSAGAGTLVASGGATAAGFGGTIRFFGSSTAAAAALILDGGAVRAGGSGHIDFLDDSTAAQATITNNGAVFGGSVDRGGELQFHRNASAAQAAITNHGGNVAGASGGLTRFLGSSTASTATIINNGGGAAETIGGTTGFYDNASAGHSVIVSNGGAHPVTSGGRTLFSDNSTADTPTLVANGGPGNGVIVGGEISFEVNSTGGTARVEIFGNARLDVHNHNAPGVGIGSLAGTGQAFLGTNNLTVGSNNLSTEFSGVIQIRSPIQSEHRWR